MSSFLGRLQLLRSTYSRVMARTSRYLRKITGPKRFNSSLWTTDFNLALGTVRRTSSRRRSAVADLPLGCSDTDSWGAFHDCRGISRNDL